MTYDLNGKKVRIPDAEIAKSMTVLGLTEEEAIQMWLEDEGYLENEEVEELTAKAKVNKVNHEAKADKPRKTSKRAPKPDEQKEEIVKMLADCLKTAGFEPEITNKTKIIEFVVDGVHFKLDLIRQRGGKK